MKTTTNRYIKQNDRQVLECLSKGYAVLIALLPVVMMYNVPIINLGLSTTIIAAGMFFAYITVVSQIEYVNWKAVVVISVFLVYAMMRSDGKQALLSFSILIHILAISTGIVDANQMIRTIRIISLVAAVGVIIQAFVHVLLGIHIPMIIPDFCLRDLAYYRNSILTGFPRHEMMYRPSAFFLEPSHLAMYCTVALCFMLLKRKPDYIQALIVSIGVLSSTSGMGIVMIAFVWTIHPFVGKKINLVRVFFRMICMAILLVGVFFILYRFSFFQNAMNRIMGPVEHSSTQYNAIWGRTLYWDVYITPLKGNDLLFGMGNNGVVTEDFFTGLMTLIYDYGIFGTALFYINLFIIMMQARSVAARFIVVIYGGILIFANLVGFINVIFYVGVVISARDSCVNEYPRYQHKATSKYIN